MLLDTVPVFACCGGSLDSKCCFFFSSRRRHTRCSREWSSDVCSSDLSRSGPGRRRWWCCCQRRGWFRPWRCPGRRGCRRSEEHTSELQSRLHLVCRLLLEKKKTSPHTHSRRMCVCANHAAFSSSLVTA